MKTIAISIVTYNSQDVFETLDNIVEVLIPQGNIEVYLFDNHSSEEYRVKLKAYQSLIKIHFYHENMGFGYGHNYNLSLSQEDYFIVYNPDILISATNLVVMYEFMEQNLEIAMSVPKVLNVDGSTQHLIRRKLDVFDYLLRFIPIDGVRKLFDKRLATYECRDLTEDRQPILFGSGCFMFFRTSKLRKIKGFDEQFFMYFEDNDICQRLRAENETIYYLPDAQVTHFYAKGAHKSKRLFKIFLKSMIQYFNKWGWTFF
ncbi:glycosyltransferase [uncultured Vagococcus sp.]|uniref:glycosyltransferase n=1 Tax=uncultured Vagococcus sp. TaxID=189676 RepID=UPI0037DCE313